MTLTNKKDVARVIIKKEQELHVKAKINPHGDKRKIGSDRWFC